MKHTLTSVFTLAMLMVVGATSILADEKQISSLSIPINIDMTILENKLNAQIPKRILTINQSHICVKERWVRVNLVFDELVTRISPNIHCNISGYIDKRAPLTLNGSGNSFTITLPVKARISGKVIGIRETADAAATFYVSAKPQIDEDWNLSLDVKSDYRWDQVPILKLFDIIKITMADLVDPKLRQELNKFDSQIPAIIKDIQIRNKIEQAWNSIQEPIRISQQPEVYLTFKPTHTGFSGFSIQNTNINARIAIAGETQITIGNPSANSPIPLLALNKENLTDSGFNIILPVFISAKEIQSTIDKNLNKSIEIEIDEMAFKGTFSARDFKISVTKTGGILLKAKIQFINKNTGHNALNIANGGAIKGDASIELLAKIDENKQEIMVEKINFTSSTNNLLADTLVKALKLPIVKNKLMNSLRYDYSKNLSDILINVNDALNSQSNKDIKISGNISEIGARKLRFLDNMIVVDAYSKGNVSVSLAQD